MVLVWEWGGVALDKAAPGQLVAKILIGDSTYFRLSVHKRGGYKNVFNNYDIILILKKDI